MSAQLSGLEILDMRDGQVGDSLTITKDVVNAFGVNNDHTSSITPTSIPPVYVGKVDIYVRGDAQVADTVNLQGAGWTLAGDTITLGSEVYDVLVNGIDVDEAVIAIQQGVTVNAP